MSGKKVFKLITEDLAALVEPTPKNFFKYLLFNASFRITFCFRVLHGMWCANRKGLMYWLGYLHYKHLAYRTGIQLPIATEIGGGAKVCTFFLHCD